MFTKSGLTLAVACGIVLLTAGAADAQIVAFDGSGYQAGGVGQPSTIAPFGKFSTQIYPNGDGGKFRVLVDYGQLSNGGFARYALNIQGVPNPTGSTPVVVGRGGSNFTWAIQRMNGSGIDQNSYIRAQLQRSTDGGTTWKDIGTPSYLKALPTP